MSGNRPDQIPLPFVTAALAFLVSLYFRNHLVAPIATVAGFFVGVWVLYQVGKWELETGATGDDSFRCPVCRTPLHVSAGDLSVTELIDNLKHMRSELSKTKKENR